VYDDYFCSQACATFDLGTSWIVYQRETATNKYSTLPEFYPSQRIAEAEAQKIRDRMNKLKLHSKLYGTMEIPSHLPLHV
jgi:hypothetical protein